MSIPSMSMGNLHNCSKVFSLHRALEVYPYLPCECSSGMLAFLQNILALTEWALLFSISVQRQMFPSYMLSECFFCVRFLVQYPSAEITSRDATALNAPFLQTHRHRLFLRWLNFRCVTS